MSYDLFVRADRHHRERRRIDEVTPILERLGLRPGRGAKQWVREVGRDRLEVYLSWVEPGSDDNDALPGDGVHTNEIACHPSPVRWANLAVVHQIAATLGWEIHDPQHGVALRDAIARVPDEAPGPRFAPASPARPALRTIGKDGWRENARQLLALPGDRWVVGYSGRTMGSPIGVQLRAGADLALRGEVRGAIRPFAVSPDGAWLLAGGPQAGHEPHGTTVFALEDDRAVPAQVWPCYPIAAWLPDWPGAFVAVLRDRDGQRTLPPKLVPAGAAALRKLEQQGRARLVIVDTDAEAVYPLRADEILGSVAHCMGELAISPDGARVYLATSSTVHAFSLRSGELLWRHPFQGSIYALAVDAAGARLAVGGLPRGNAPSLLHVLDAVSGAVQARVGQGHWGTTSSTHALAFHPSGWLAVGLASGQAYHWATADASGSPDGGLRTYQALGGGVESLAFSSDGRTLLAAGTHEGIRAIPLLDDEVGRDVAAKPATAAEAARPATPAKPTKGAKLATLAKPAKATTPARPAKPTKPATSTKPAKRWRFSDDPRPAAEPWVLLANDGGPAEVRAARLATMDDATFDAQLPALRRQARARASMQDTLTLVPLWAITTSAARRARAAGRFLDDAWREPVGLLALHAGPPWTLPLLDDIAAAIRDDLRADWLLAIREPPTWARYRHAISERTLRDLIVEISGWQRGAFTRLSKAFPKHTYLFGYNAKELERNAIATLAMLGAAAPEALAAAAKAKVPLRAWFEKAAAQRPARPVKSRRA